MSAETDDLLQTFLEESQDGLADIEQDLLHIEKCGAQIDEERVNKVFRAAHSIKGGAGFVGLQKIQSLAHKMETVLGMFRTRKLIPDSQNINQLLRAADILKELVLHPEESEKVDTSTVMERLNAVGASEAPRQPICKDAAVPSTPAVNAAASDGTLAVAVPGCQAALFVSPPAVAQAQQDRKQVFLIRFGKNRDENDAAILEELNPYGQLLAEHSEASGLEAGCLYALFASVLAGDDLAALLEGRSAKIWTVRVPACEGGGIPEGSFSAAETAEGDPGSKKEWMHADEPAAGPNSGKAPVTCHDFNDIDSALEPAERNTQPFACSDSPPSSIRVQLKLLNAMMDLAGELVLARNQLNRNIADNDIKTAQTAVQRLNSISSELQETIMLTRMQPIGTLFRKFSRVVRDLARELGKEVEVEIDDQDVELDRTLMENLRDPLTHLVRNAVDHGIEPVNIRKKLGKKETGRIVLRAIHEAGQVIVEVSDDGRGIDADRIAAAAVEKGFATRREIDAMGQTERMGLVFRPGFSTAEAVCTFSGRGVGMDVVKTNLDRLGGRIEMESSPGRGMKIRIKLPLTLAIMTGQMVSAEGQMFAIPQINLQELVRIAPHRVEQRIERVGDAEVVRLRGKLLPLVRLSDVLDLPCVPQTESNHHRGINIAVVSTGLTAYGLVVDRFYDSEEIVVKPLGSHLEHIAVFTGATIMGDGRVSLILDIGNIALAARLSCIGSAGRHSSAVESAVDGDEPDGDRLSLLVFGSGKDQQFAVDLHRVLRLKKVAAAAIEDYGGRRSIRYRGGNLPLLSIDQIAEVRPWTGGEKVLVLVLQLAGSKIGVLADWPVDSASIEGRQLDETMKHRGIRGTFVHEGRTTFLVETEEIEKFFRKGRITDTGGTRRVPLPGKTLMVVDDSAFFRKKIREFLGRSGFEVVEAEDGVAALEKLDRIGKQIALVITDIEMPRLDGFELCRRLRADHRFGRVPVIGLSTLADEADIAKGRSAGLDEYLIKLDKHQLLGSIETLIHRINLENGENHAEVT